MGHRPSSRSQRRPMEMPVWRRHMTRSGLCFDMVTTNTRVEKKSGVGEDFRFLFEISGLTRNPRSAGLAGSAGPKGGREGNSESRAKRGAKSHDFTPLLGRSHVPS